MGCCNIMCNRCFWYGVALVDVEIELRLVDKSDHIVRLFLTRNKKPAETSERPGFINSITGLGTTVINIYTARGGVWSVTAIVTTAVTGTCTVFMLTMLVLYHFRLLWNVKKDHEKRMERIQRVDRSLSWSDY